MRLLLTILFFLILSVSFGQTVNDLRPTVTMKEYGNSLVLFINSLMKEIKLTQGKVALVDDEDYDFLIQWKWFASFDKMANTFYASRTLHGETNKTIRMHRIIMNVSISSELVDHINHNGLHNYKSNLRIATKGQNNSNVRSHRGSTSKFLGVSWNKQLNKWRVVVQKDRKQIYLGHFKEEKEAAITYNTYASKLFGKFANLNEV